MSDIYNVCRRNKTKSTNIGDFKTMEEAESAMLEHYRKTPKLGKFYYTISPEKLDTISGVVYRTFDLTQKVTCYTQTMLKEMV